jgi:hypothetical protein
MSNRLLYIYQKERVLKVYHGAEVYESRGIILEKMIKEAAESQEINQNYRFLINTDDSPIQHNINGISCYSFSTITKDYDHCCPCYIFHSWPEVGIDNYSRLTDSFIDSEPESSKVGWIGHPMSIPRKIFNAYYSNTYFSQSLINDWNRSDPKQLHIHTKTYLTFQQQIDKWKYLIDFEGAGYSGRTKILLNSPRIVFFVDREYQEFWQKKLIPWKHYVPVKKDLSDLEENYSKIEKDKDLQRYIKNEQKQFCQENLLYKHAILELQRIIKENIYVES